MGGANDSKVLFLDVQHIYAVGAVHDCFDLGSRPTPVGRFEARTAQCIDATQGDEC
jgi:hypothetical protein